MSNNAQDKMFILNDNAKNDPAVQIVMANYVQQLKREEARRQAILSGEYIPCPETVWNISDRDWWQVGVKLSLSKPQIRWKQFC